jgi:uncharacterized protein (TIGR03435 family)
MRNMLGIVIAVVSLSSVTRNTAAQNQGLAFEVASVKPVAFDAPRVAMRFQGDRFTGRNIVLLNYIIGMYGVQPTMVAGMPDWATNGGQGYDIEAKAPEGKTSRGEMVDMVKTLLADRFKLTLHREMREVAGYNLVVGKKGPKLGKQTAEEADRTGTTIQTRGCNLTAKQMSMAELSRLLVGMIGGRQVWDKTGLPGRYDFSWECSLTEGVQSISQTSPPDPNGPTVFDVLEDKLGLKLEQVQGPADFLVIDHAEKPSEN